MRVVPEEAIVRSVGAAEAGDAPGVDLEVEFGDGRVERARVRADRVPEGLAPGDRVRIVRAALYRRWTVLRADA